MKFAPLHIGSLTIPFPVLLAPMAGYTDSAFRSLCCRHHCGAVFTEVITAAGIVHGSGRTLNYLKKTPAERPIAAHLYGSDPDIVAGAAAEIEAMGGFDFIDLNCGCPVRKIVAKGAGAALMKKPEQIEAIVRALRAAVSLPVTVKTRIGHSPGRFPVSDIARAVEQGGGQAIFVHARYTINQHSGPADWDALAQLKASCSIPVIGNGGVDRAADALDMQARTGVDGVMIGRAAVGNPWIFDEILHLAEGTPYVPPTRKEIRATIVEHLERLTDLTREERRRRKARLTAEETATLRFRGHLVQYLRRYPGFSTIRRELQTLKHPTLLMEAVDRVLASGADGSD